MPRVMLVDDSSAVRAHMSAILEPFGFELAQAESGREAIELGSASRWDLFLFDVSMPGMSGVDALSALRKGGCTTPTVLVTSMSTPPVIAGALRLGGVHYLAKPYTPDMLKAVVTKLLKLPASAVGVVPRALVQAPPEVAAVLGQQLPRHVVVDRADTHAEAITLAATHHHSLVLFAPAGDAQDEARALRETTPAAAIFALDSKGTAPLWSPDGALDGRLGQPLDASLGGAVLYPTFLRPLAFADGVTVRAAGHNGAPSLRGAYLEMLARRLAERCTTLDLIEPELDLRDVVGDTSQLVALVLRLNRELRASGGAPAFSLPEAVRGAPELAGIVVL